MDELSEAFDALLKGNHHDPFQILGCHPATSPGKSRHVMVRCLVPDAEKAWVRASSGWQELKQTTDTGLFSGVFDRDKVDRHPRLRARWPGGQLYEWLDPYTFPPLLSDYDKHLYNQGHHYQVYEKLGAHIVETDDVSGVVFRVWAPNAVRVSVVGNFNQWDGRRHMMRSLGDCGVWELFIPELGEGELYKYEIKDRSGRLHLKSDPYAFYTEMRPNTASKVYRLDRYRWQDAEWMEIRGARHSQDQPMAIYEAHLGSWRRSDDRPNRFPTYRELTRELVPYVRDLGFTHIELLPIMAHPLDASWGYQVSGYYAPTTRYGSPLEFMEFVDACHQNEISVIVDWVPAHFPRDDHALARFDGTCLYEHEDPLKGEHPDWGTLIFNYGRNEVRSFLIANAIFWMEKYHIDGLRVDAVASMLYLDYSRAEGAWVPNPYGGRENLEAISFLRELNEVVYQYDPDCYTIAEESTAWPMVSRPTYLGGLGFGYKWNMGWMHDMLAYMKEDPVYRKYHHSKLTFSLLYAFHENFILPISHDEVVHGKGSLLHKMPGDSWQKLANYRLFCTYLYTHPGKKLLFMGCEFAQDWEWDHEQGLRWHLLDQPSGRQIHGFMKDLNKLYRNEKALWEVDFDPVGFEWVDFHDSDQSIVVFVRKAANPKDLLYCVFNFTPVVRRNYRVGAPTCGFHREIFNTDSRFYGGSDVGNQGRIEAVAKPFGGWPCSLTLTLPPLAALILKPEREPNLDLGESVNGLIDE